MPWKKSGMGLGWIQGGGLIILISHRNKALSFNLPPPQVLLDMMFRKEDPPSHLHGVQQHNLKAFHLLLDQYIQLWPQLLTLELQGYD
jgi:hypothetical protein